MPMTVAEALYSFGWLRLTGALLLGGPGVLLASLHPARRRFGFMHMAGLSFGLTLALWPVILTWLDPVAVRLNGVSVGAIGAATWAFASLRLFRDGRIRWRGQLTGARVAHASVLAVIVFLTAILGLYAVRNEVAGLGSDSYHHTLIAQVIADAGGLPKDYSPYAPLVTFRYHFGFHALAALTSWISGIELRLLVPIMGQLLVAAAAFGAAMLARALGGDRVTSIVAAALVGLVFPLPVYMLNWGRFTQLTGLVLMLVFLAELSDWVKGGLSPRTLGCVALLAAGLALAHYRVASMAALGALCIWAICGGAPGKQGASLGRQFVLVTCALVLALALVTPWAWRTVISSQPGYAFDMGPIGPSYFGVDRVGAPILKFFLNPIIVGALLVGAAGAVYSQHRGALAMGVWLGALLLFSHPKIGGGGSSRPDLNTHITAISASSDHGSGLGFLGASCADPRPYGTMGNPACRPRLPVGRRSPARPLR